MDGFRQAAWMADVLLAGMLWFLLVWAWSFIFLAVALRYKLLK